MNTDDFFPIVLLPYNYKILLQSNPPPRSLPLPFLPFLLSFGPPTPPLPPEKPNSSYFYIILVIAFMIAMFFLLFLPFLSLIIFGFMFRGMYWFYKSEHKKEYSNKLREYNKQKDEYPSRLETYNRQQKEYNFKLNAYEIEKNKPYSKEELRQWRLKEMRESNFTNDIQSYSVDNSQLAQKGRTEDFFLNKLKSSFDSLIHTNVKIGYYYPDFIYEEDNITIDIEIDEPYEAINLQPIHYKGIDDRRNDYFVQQNYVVIRFSEEQIVRHSDACCKFIRLFIENYKNFIHLDKQALLNQSGLPSIKTWSKDEAAFLAGKNYRNSY